jgi:hypothetical protein
MSIINWLMLPTRSNGAAVAEDVEVEDVEVEDVEGAGGGPCANAAATKNATPVAATAARVFTIASR